MANQTAQAFSKHQLVGFEFLNSLTSVRSLSELLVEFPGLDAGDRLRFLGIIHKETGRLLNLLAELKLVPELGAPRQYPAKADKCSSKSTAPLSKTNHI
ncbi:MAG: hypothetical protein HY911_00690 [Desulfobacterales bacterium]|nr:hypothetical protein [Desulfobacterales bacterium]